MTKCKLKKNCCVIATTATHVIQFLFRIKSKNTPVSAYWFQKGPLGGCRPWFSVSVWLEGWAHTESIRCQRNHVRGLGKGSLWVRGRGDGKEGKQGGKRRERSVKSSEWSKKQLTLKNICGSWTEYFCVSEYAVSICCLSIRSSHFLHFLWTPLHLPSIHSNLSVFQTWFVLEQLQQTC